MGLNVGKLQADLEVDITGFRRDMERAGDQFVQFGRSADQTATQARQSLGRIGEGVGDAARQAANDFDTQMGNIRRSADQNGQQAGDQFRQGFNQGTSGLGDGITDQIRQGAGAGGDPGGAGEQGGDGFSGGFIAGISRLGAKGGPIALAITAGIAGAAAIGKKFADEVMAGFDIQAEKAHTKVSFGWTDDQAAEAGKAAGAAYRNNFGESADQLAQAAGIAMQAGILDGNATSEQIQPVIERMSTLADLMGEEIPAVARAAGQMIKTGIADNSTEAFDVLFVAQQKGLNLSEDLLDTVNEYGTQWRKVGLDATDALGLVAQAMQHGARDGDVAADAIKEFAIRAQDGSETTSEAFQTLNLNAEEMQATFAKGGPEARKGLDTILDGIRKLPTDADKATVAAALFGTQWEDLGGAFEHFDLSTARNELGNTAGAAKRAMDDLGENGASSVESLKRNLETIRTDIQSTLGEALGPAAAELSGWISEHRDEIIQFVSMLAKGALDTGIAFANMGAGVLHVFGFISDALGPFVGGIIDGLGKTWTVLGSVIEAIPGLGGIGRTIKGAGEAAQSFGDAMQNSGDAMHTAANFLADDLAPGLASARDAIDGMGQSTELTTKQVGELVGQVNELPRDKAINVTAPGGQNVLELLTDMGAKVHADNSKNIVVDAPLAEDVIDTLDRLGIKVRTDNNKSILVTDSGTAKTTQDNIDAIHGKAVNVQVSGTFVGQLGQLMTGQAVPQANTYPGGSPGGAVHIPGNAAGGPIVGPGTKTSDSVLMWGSNGEFVQQAAAVDYYGPGFMHAINQRRIPKDALPGYADGGIVGYGLPSGTAISSGGPGFPDWVTRLGSEHGVQPSTYAGHQESDRGEAGYAPNPEHLNRGIDWTGTVDAMDGFARYLFGIAPSSPELEQIIWQNPNTGAKVGWHGRTPDDGSYFAADYGGHQDHVHTRQSGPIGVATPALRLSGAPIDITLTADSSRDDVARKIIAEGRKRGYSDAQIADILSTAIQESNLTMASGGGGAWHGIFQQDSSYPGRDDPNTNITGFYDRLDEKKGTQGWSKTMDDNIFWVQQRPGETSAQSAVANGRSGYMDEINAHQDEANEMVSRLGPTVVGTININGAPTGTADTQDDTSDTGSTTPPDDPTLFEFTINNPFEPFWWKGEKQYQDHIIANYEAQKAWNEYQQGNPEDATKAAEKIADLQKKVADAKVKIQEADDAVALAEQRRREVKADAPESSRMSADQAVTKAKNDAADARTALTEAEDELTKAQNEATKNASKTSGANPTSGLNVTTDSMRRMAGGGGVSGPGGPRDDLVPAMLSDGEYVHQASAVDYYGTGFMDAVNAKRFPRTIFRADGGFAGYGGDDNSDVMAPKNWYDWVGMGVGAGFAAYNTIDPYVGMAMSGQVNLSSVTPTINTGTTDLGYPSSILSNLGGQISSQIQELIRAVKEGKNIKVVVESPNAPRAFDESMLASMKAGA
ncbi:phage tail tape measure protein [Gordonia sp. NPDC003376]